MGLLISVCLPGIDCSKYLAANGAIMRTSLLGVLDFNGEYICLEGMIDITNLSLNCPISNQKYAFSSFLIGLSNCVLRF